MIQVEDVARFSQTERLTCIFNSTVVPASATVRGGVQCITPSHPAGLVAVRIANGFQVLSLAPLFFRFEYVRLGKSYPATGPISGGTLIFVSGINARLGPFLCWFGLTKTMSVASDIDQVYCRTPPAKAAHVTSVQLICGNATCGLPLAYAYHDDPVMLHVDPTIGPGTRSHPLKQLFVSLLTFCCFADLAQLMVERP